MSYRNRKRTLLSLFAIAFMSTFAVSVANSATLVRAPAPVRMLYVADAAHNAVDLFPAGVVKPKQLGAITAGINIPVDVFVDTAGTLYVANDANANPATVTEYAAGSSVPMITLSLGAVHPLYLTVGPDGTVYIMVYNIRQRYKVLEFEPGHFAPSRSIAPSVRIPLSFIGSGVAVSKDNLLYVNEGGYSANGGFSVFVFLPKHITSSRDFL